MRHVIFISSFLLLLALAPFRVGAVSLSPSVFDIQSERSAVTSHTLTVVNASDAEQLYFLSVLKFIPSDDGGSPQFIPFEQDHLGFPEWIKLPFTEFRVAANTKATVPFEIAVPNDVVSGGYYAAIAVSQAPSDVVASNGSSVEAKTAVLLLLTVQGNTREKLELLEFLDDGQLNGAESRFSGWPVSRLSRSYSYRVQNQGNVHVTPVGKVNIKDFFGRTVMSVDANQDQSRILPSSTRRYQVEIPVQTRVMELIQEQMRTFSIGPMVAELDLTYGTSQQSIQKTISFWYFPWQLLLTVVGLSVILRVLLIRRKSDVSKRDHKRDL